MDFLENRQGLLLRGMALSIPISIGFTQVFFYAFILSGIRNLKQALSERALDPLRNQLLAWQAVLIVSSAASLDFERSIGEVFKSFLYLIFLLFAVSYICRKSFGRERLVEASQILLFLIIGQSLAALHSIISFGLGSSLRFGMPGEVTESGQLALVLPVIMGIVVSTRAERVLSQRRMLSGCLFLCLVMFSAARFLAPTFAIGLQIISLVGVVALLWKLSPFRYFSGLGRATINQMSFLSLALIPILVTAFVVNLKRGPWLGVFLATLVVGILLAKRKIALGAIGTGILMVSLPPVRERLFNLVADFTIAGGRERMWGLGIDLASRFPLGVGPKNAIFMRTLDPFLPPTHRHLHNNLLNIVVETGYMGGVIYLWLIASIIALGFRWRRLAQSGDLHLSQAAIMAVSLSAAVLSWQCAGLVEYNFGDAEIKMLVYLILAFLLGMNNLLEISEPLPRVTGHPVLAESRRIENKTERLLPNQEMTKI